MNILETLSALLTKKNTANVKELESFSSRNRLSQYMPWLSYDDETKRFLNLDNTFGYAWELCPLVYQGTKQTAAIEGILKQSFPAGTNIQVILFPDNNIKPVLDFYKATKTGDTNPVTIKAIDETIKFLDKGKTGLKNIKDVPLRQYRAFFFIKSEENLSEYIQTISEMLAAAELHPRQMNDRDLLSFLDRLINDGDGIVNHYTSANQDDVIRTNRPLRDYAVSRETEFEFSGKTSTIGNRYAACLSVKSTPDRIHPLMTNNLFGGVFGAEDDTNQHNYNYFYSFNIIFNNNSEELETKAKISLSQKQLGNFIESIRPRLEDFQQYRSNVSRNKTYVKVIPTMWIFGKTRAELEKNVGRAKSVFGRADAGSFTYERESLMQSTLFLASLPFGLYDVGNNINLIDRHLYMSTEAVARILPIQGDFAGNGSPVTLLVGRKGQICCIDLFAPGSPNNNFLVCAESGGGKSFLLNTILGDNKAQGEKIRIVDIGGSYEKLCDINNGKYIRLTLSGEVICINPLDFKLPLNDPDRLMENIEKNLKAAATVFGQMVYSKSGQALTDMEWNLICQACEWAYNEKRLLEGTDAIYFFLKNLNTLCDEDEETKKILVDLGLVMAFNLKKFTTQGSYGRFFCGKSTMRISEDDFVVVELEEIKADPQLFGVVVLQMMNEITQDLYLSDRKDRRFILFEEAPSLLIENGNSDLTRLAAMVEEGYRRARKYGGSFGVVMQSILDTLQMGSLGRVIVANAAYKFMLSSKSSQYEQAAELKIIKYEGFALNLLNSLKNNKPNYSEVFIEAPQGMGVARLIVDPFRYKVNTTEAPEVARYYEAIKAGKTKLEAVEAI